jgi:NADH-quinone oxidoreductase subunit C
MSSSIEQIAEHVAAGLDGAIMNSKLSHGELTLTVSASEIVRTLTYLRDDPNCRFTILIDLCGVDYPDRAERFEVVYHLLSISENARIRVKIATDSETAVPSVTSVFQVADWFEREAFDMYGILFTGHPDLRRLLTDYGFSGYPLRKDFPLTGHVEVRYDDEQKRVVYEPVKLVQEFRDFDFMSPWEGAKYVLPGDDKAADADQPDAPKK